MKSIERFLLSKNFSIFLFLVSWIFVFAIYFPGHKAMLIDDGISGLWEFKKLGFNGYLHSYSMKSFYYGYFGFLALVYFLFGTNPLGWFIVFSFLHALNTTFIFKAFQKLYAAFSLQNGQWIAFVGAILFLVSPYQSENVIWAATSHYSLTLFVLLFGIHWICDFMNNGASIKSIIVFHSLFIFALLTLEISFFFPVIFFLLFLIILVQQRNKSQAIPYLLKIAFLQILIVGIYLFIYHSLYGHWIPNRYDEPHSLSIAKLTITLAQQTVKLFSFIHFSEYKTREIVYEFCAHWKKTSLILGTILLAISLFVFKKDKSKMLLLLFFIISGIILFYPFLESYFMYLFRIENDRYLYFGSVFFLQAFVFVVFYFKPIIRIPIILIYITAFVYFIFPTVKARRTSAKLYYNFIQKFPVAQEGKIIILNVPNYCADVYEFRAKSRLPISIEAEYGMDISKKIIQVASYSSVSEKDSFEVNRINDTTLFVKTKTNGTWWMNESIGLTNYENEYFRLEKDEWGGYHLFFKKQLSAADKIYYYSNGRFILVH